MNRILCEIKEIIAKNVQTYLPHVTAGDLEGNGTVYYMNGRDGTEFDWYINEKLPPFMVFYNDEANLGAVKLLLYSDGSTVVYLYGDQGKELVQEVHERLDVSPADLLELAVTLRNEADDRRIWEAGIETIQTDLGVSEEQVTEFKGNQKRYEVIINRKRILNLKALVSKKITEEGWKVGYLERAVPIDEQDSGWRFFAGNEDGDYTADAGNIALMNVGAVWQLDSDVFRFIDAPVGTKLIRVSSNAFEADKGDKGIYMEKR